MPPFHGTTPLSHRPRPGGDAFEGIPKHRVGAHTLVHREITLEHATLTEQRVSAPLGAPRPRPPDPIQAATGPTSPLAAVKAMLPRKRMAAGDGQLPSNGTDREPHSPSVLLGSVPDDYALTGIRKNLAGFFQERPEAGLDFIIAPDLNRK